MLLSSHEALSAEVWASEWLGAAWSEAALGDRQPEHDVCSAVVDLVRAPPTPSGG